MPTGSHERDAGETVWGRGAVCAMANAFSTSLSDRWVGQSSLKGGGGVLEPKSPKVCVPKTAKSIFPFVNIHFSHNEIRV